MSYSFNSNLVFILKVYTYKYNVYKNKYNDIEIH